MRVSARKQSWAISGPLSTAIYGYIWSFTVSPDDIPPSKITRVRAATATFQAGHTSSILVTRSTASLLMGLQQCFVEAFCCLSPLPVSTPLPLTLREVYD
jgi:hypothetical protein